VGDVWSVARSTYDGAIQEGYEAIVCPLNPRASQHTVGGFEAGWVISEPAVLACRIGPRGVKDHRAECPRRALGASRGLHGGNHSERQPECERYLRC
jgi:hypothetical protein